MLLQSDGDKTGWLVGPYLQHPQRKWQLCLKAIRWKKVVTDFCISKVHLLRCGRALAARCTLGLLLSGGPGRGLRRSDWGSANGLFLCGPRSGQTVRISWGGKKTQKTKASCNDVREKESDEGIFGKTNGCDVQHVLDVSLIGVEKHLHIG